VNAHDFIWHPIFLFEVGQLRSILCEYVDYTVIAQVKTKIKLDRMFETQVSFTSTLTAILLLSIMYPRDTLSLLTS
jgi:hypothetical protein